MSIFAQLIVSYAKRLFLNEQSANSKQWNEHSVKNNYKIEQHIWRTLFSLGSSLYFFVFFIFLYFFMDSIERFCYFFVIWIIYKETMWEYDWNCMTCATEKNTQLDDKFLCAFKSKQYRKWIAEKIM